MLKKHRIIALIDFSENAETIIESAIAFSTISLAEIHLLHQVPSLTPVLSDTENKKTIIEAEKLQAKYELDHLTREYALMNQFHYHITERELTSYLREMQSENHTDWILCGLKRTGNLKRIFLGSTATRIVDDTDLLTIALPLQNKFSLPETLAVGVNNNYPINKPALLNFLQTLENTIRNIELFTMVTDEESELFARQYLEELIHSFDGYNCTYQIFKGTHPLKEIKNYMLKNINTYLVIQQGSRNLIDLLFRQLMVNELVYHAEIPLIILPK